MDLRTGKTYATVEDARADGVPESDIAFIRARDALQKTLDARPADDAPVVTFASGPFKDRRYRRTAAGQLVRVDRS